jgi:hypothetical protein
MTLKLYIAFFLVVTESIFSSLPFHDPWFDLFVLSILMSAATSGMPEPKANSTDFYVWTYRTMHLLFHMGTSYVTHKSFWPAFEAEEIRPKARHMDRPKVFVSEPETTALARPIHQKHEE